MLLSLKPCLVADMRDTVLHPACPSRRLPRTCPHHIHKIIPRRRHSACYLIRCDSSFPLSPTLLSPSILQLPRRCDEYLDVHGHADHAAVGPQPHLVNERNIVTYSVRSFCYSRITRFVSIATTLGPPFTPMKRLSLIILYQPPPTHF